MKVLHNTTSIKTALTPAASAVVKVLAYYDVFKYPLTLPEIEKYASIRFFQLSVVTTAIDYLKEKLIVFQFGEFYTLRNEFSLVTRRTTGNLAAFNIMDKATKRAALIQKFPFVKSVNISGSLSKNYFDKSTDIDFFVITQPGRLWICRVILTVFKKIFLLNSRKYFCINYYIDSKNLEIPDKNLFSATEIITLRNMTGSEYFEKFILANDWVKAYFPNHMHTSTVEGNAISGFWKNMLEKIFSGRLGDICDNYAQQITQRFIQSKYKHLNAEQKEVNLRTKKSVSKHHPQGFQFKVLTTYESTCMAIEEKHSVILL